jgi:hypothetical protein
MWSCLVGLCSRRWALLVPFTAFALSPAIWLPTAWWAYSLELTPLLVAMLAAVRAQLTFIRTGTVGHAFAAIGWTAAGLLFWDKAVLIPLVVFGITLVLAPRTVRPYWKVWLGYVLLIGAYAVAYLVVTRHDTAFPLRPHEIPALAGIMAGRTFLPELLGGPWTTATGTSWAVGSPVLLAIVWAGTAAVLMVGVRVGRARAVVAFAVVLGYLAVDIALVAAGRLGAIGAMIGGDPRYTADAVPVALLCASAALLTGPVRAVRFRRGGALGVSAALGLSAALAGSAAVTTLGPPFAPTDVARTYVTTAAAAVRADPDLVLYDGAVPSGVLVAWFGQQDRVSVALGALRPPPAYDQPTGDLRILDDTGTPRPIVLFGAATSAPGPVAGCGYAVTARGTDIPLTTTAHGDRPVVRIGYYTGGAGAGIVEIGGRSMTVTFQPGVHYLFVVADGPPTGIRVTALDNTVCVTDVTVGMPLPARR